MVDRHALDDRLQKHGFSRAGGCYDESALAIPNRRNEVDGSASELRSALRRLTGFELEFPLRIRCDEGSEIGSARCFSGIDTIDLLDVDYDDAIAVIVSGRRENLI